jgi:alpha-ribazole phosphatase
MEIYLARHTKVAPERGICYGFTDVELAESQLHDIETSKNKLGNSFDAVYSSTLTRCRKLAAAVEQNHITDERLKELNFGDWEMMCWDKIPEKALLDWRNDFVNIACPNGEAFIDMKNRCVSFLDDLSKKDYKKVAIVTHGGFIRTALSYALKMPLEHSLALRIDYGSISKIEISDGKYSIHFMNL